MRWILSLALALSLLSGCTSDPVLERAQTALRDHNRLMAAVQQQDTESYAAALNRLRPGVNALIRELEKTDPRLAGELRNPFLRLEAESQKEAFSWDVLLREAVLMENVLRRVADH